MTRDFTLSKYRELCKAFLSSGYNTITVQEHVQGQAVEPFVILRHDVDRRPQMAIFGQHPQIPRGRRLDLKMK